MSEHQVLSQIETVKNNQTILQEHHSTLEQKLIEVLREVEAIKSQLTYTYAGNLHDKLDTIIRQTR